MPVKQLGGLICSRPYNLVGTGERLRNTRNLVCHFRMGRLEMQLPFFRKPNRTTMDVLERLHCYIYALLPLSGSRPLFVYLMKLDKQNR